MFKNSSRLLGILLSLSFMVDPAMAAAASMPVASRSAALTFNGRFAAEAFSMRAIWESMPFQSSGVREARHNGSSFDRLFAGQSDGLPRSPEDYSLFRRLGLTVRRDELPPEVLIKSVDEMDVSVGTYYVLKNASLETIGKILDLTEAQFLRIKHAGRVGLEEVKDALRQELHSTVTGKTMSMIQMFASMLERPNLADEVPIEIAEKSTSDLMIPVSERQTLLRADKRTVGSILNSSYREIMRIKPWHHNLEYALLELLKSPPTKSLPVIAMARQPEMLAAAFPEPEALTLFQSEAAKFGFTRFELLSAPNPAQTRHLIGVKLIKNIETGHQWRVHADELLVYRHFGESISDMYKQEKRIDAQTPKTRAMLQALLRVEKARVERSGPFYDALETKGIHPDKVKNALAAQSYLEISPKGSATSQILQDIAQFIWFVYVFRSPTSREDHRDERAFGKSTRLYVDGALKTDFPWLNPVLASEMTNRILELDKSFDPLYLRSPKEDMLFAGQSSGSPMPPTNLLDAQVPIQGVSRSRNDQRLKKLMAGVAVAMAPFLIGANGGHPILRFIGWTIFEGIVAYIVWRLISGFFNRRAHAAYIQSLPPEPSQNPASFDLKVDPRTATLPRHQGTEFFRVQSVDSFQAQQIRMDDDGILGSFSHKYLIGDDFETWKAARFFYPKGWPVPIDSVHLILFTLQGDPTPYPLGIGYDRLNDPAIYITLLWPDQKVLDAYLTDLASTLVGRQGPTAKSVVEHPGLGVTLVEPHTWRPEGLKNAKLELTETGFRLHIEWNKASAHKNRNTMPSKTGRFGNPGPAVDIFYGYMGGASHIRKYLDEGRIVYNVSASVAYEFDPSISRKSKNTYSLRRDSNGKIVSATTDTDEFVHIYRMGSGGRIGQVTEWGRPLPPDEVSRLEKAATETIQAHKANVKGITSKAVDVLLHPQLHIPLYLEVRETHDYWGEANADDDVAAHAIIDRELLKEENYKFLVLTLIDEIGHAITREGDASNTPNSIHVYAMHLFDTLKGDFEAALESLHEMFEFLGVPWEEINHTFPGNVDDIFSAQGSQRRIVFSRLIDRLSHDLADLLLKRRGEAKMPGTGDERWTMPSIRGLTAGKHVPTQNDHLFGEAA